MPEDRGLASTATIESMTTHRTFSLGVLVTAFSVLTSTGARTDDQPRFSAELVFPLHHQHNHAPGIVECRNGDLLVSWYRGSGERQADDDIQSSQDPFLDGGGPAGAQLYDRCERWRPN